MVGREVKVEGETVIQLGGHPDVERVTDVLVSYEPRHVIALLTELQHDEVQKAARKLRGKNKASWNNLIEKLNKAAEVYASRPSRGCEKTSNPGKENRYGERTKIAASLRTTTTAE